MQPGQHFFETFARGLGVMKTGSHELVARKDAGFIDCFQAGCCEGEVAASDQADHVPQRSDPVREPCGNAFGLWGMAQFGNQRRQLAQRQCLAVRHVEYFAASCRVGGRQGDR